MTKDDKPFRSWGFGQRHYVDERVTSYNQNGGITAGVVNLGPQVRRLPSETVAVVSKALAGHIGRAVILFSGRELHGHKLAEDYARAFQTAGWEVQIVNEACGQSHSDIVLTVHDKNGGEQAVRALSDAGIRVRQAPSDGPPFGIPATISLALGEADQS